MKKINSLKRTPRMGWLEIGISLSEAEDVAQHSFETSVIAMLLVDSLQVDVDVEKTLRMAIIHDWAESITGDFSKKISEEIGLDVKEEIEEKIMEDLLEMDIPKREQYLEIWREYTERSSREARIVYASDLLSILFEASELPPRVNRLKEVDRIRGSVTSELETLVDCIPVLADFLQKLEK